MTTAISPEHLALQEVLAGRYSIERELGRGGMGIVPLARDVALDRPVTIKLLPPHLVANPEVGSIPNLTLALERAEEIGEHVDRRLAAVREAQGLLE